MTESFRPFDIGISPEAAISGPILLQSDHSTTLISNAKKKIGEYHHSAGHGVVTFKHCTISKFGYSNDEARWTIPRTKHLGYGGYKVFESDWDDELDRLNRFTFSNYERPKRRHFVWLFHDSSFECLAGDFSARVSKEPLATILAEVCRALERE